MTQKLADAPKPYDVPRPFYNKDVNKRIPEKRVYPNAPSTGWKIGYKDASVTSGFNEIANHGYKENVLYLDDKNQNPDKPAKISGKVNVGIDYTIGGDKEVSPWYSGKVIRAENTTKPGEYGYGNQVTIETNQVYEYQGKKYTIYNDYSHLENMHVKKGDDVNVDTYIGKMGKSGLPSNFGEHVDFQSYIMVNDKKIQISPNLMQRNLEKQQQSGTFRYSQNTNDSTTVASNTITQNSQQFDVETATNSSRKVSYLENQSLMTQETDSKTDVSKVVTLLKENAAEVKNQYGVDVNTQEGLGKAVMQYWKENNLDPKTLKDQLPAMKESELDKASASLSKSVVTETTKTKQLVLN
jgi:murein DD-endopeptidase MepM/ murein hydrolase activator NlpD